MSRRILIIGNSDGIGAAITTALIARGDRVVGVSRSPSPRPDARARHEVCDVTSPDFPGLLQRLLQEEGGFDACIYCAGIGSGLRLPDLSNEIRVFDVNLTGMVHTMTALVPGWIERRSGHFVGLSSLADAVYNADAPSYSASKAGFSHYLLSMALTLRPQGIAVTNVRFGFVDTKMAKAATRPMMITTEAAARHVLRCLDRRPLQVSVPRTAAAFVRVVRGLQALRVWANVGTAGRARAAVVAVALAVAWSFAAGGASLGAQSQSQTRAPASSASPARWWLDEPVRFLQTNLSETNSTVDPKALVAAVADFPANTYLLNMGGIVAQYPTRVPFHYPSAFLPPGRDLFGEVLRDAHARNIRVVGRFDLSKTQKPVFDAHPEWFFKRANGEPAIYNGLYSACINGDYYRKHALTILREALERYEVDGLFFNMFGNPTSDYSGQPMGPCHCDACQVRYRARHGRGVPDSADADHRAFMADSSREVAALIADLIHKVRPRAAFLTYIKDHTDGIMSESNTAVGRALPLWPYSASDNVERALGSEPGKMAFNLSMSFVDYPWRYAHVAPAETQLRLYQNIAHGAPPAFAMVGTMQQEDRQGLLAASAVFTWHAQHEDLYVGQRSAARVLLLAGGGDTPAYRGFFRLLSEQHIPFAVSENLRWIDDPARRFDLVIAPGAVARAPELERYVRGGGRLLVAGTTPPALPSSVPLGRPTGRRVATQGYWRVQDHTLLPSLRNTNLIFLDGEYAELAAIDRPALTLIPAAMFGPPEKVWSDKVETTTPGLVFGEHEKGRVAWVPWDVGGLYYRHSSPAHAGLMADVIDHLLPRGRQLTTSAHPLVEITVMDQPARRRTLIHLVNATGHSGTAYFPPIELRDLRITLAPELSRTTSAFTRATAVSRNRRLPITSDARGGRTFTLPALQAYEVLILEQD